MKKIYLLGIIASAALAMTSCSSDETTETGGVQNNAIEFGTYLGRDAQVRGTVTDNNFTSFAVLASYTGQTFFGTSSTPNFMYNQEVTRADANAAWGYTPVKYWPSTIGDKVSFFAYAPKGNENGNGIVLSANTATGAPTAEVTLNSAEKMVDFVAGVQMDKTFSTAQNANNKVEFELQHEMTRLGIKAKLDNEVYNTSDASKKTFVVIKDVQIDKAATDGQFYTKGTYTFSKTTGTRGTWSNQTGATSNFSLGGILNKTLQIATTAKDGTEYKAGVQGINLTNGDAVSLFKDSEYLFLIPAGETGLTDGKATATISYDIVTEDTKLANGYSVTSATKTVNLPSRTLVQGKAYTYTFVIKLNEVELSATVAEWGTPTDGGNVNVDYINNN